MNPLRCGIVPQEMCTSLFPHARILNSALRSVRNGKRYRTRMFIIRDFLCQKVKKPPLSSRTINVRRLNEYMPATTSPFFSLHINSPRSVMHNIYFRRFQTDASLPLGDSVLSSNQVGQSVRDDFSTFSKCAVKRHECRVFAYSE